MTEEELLLEVDPYHYDLNRPLGSKTEPYFESEDDIMYRPPGIMELSKEEKLILEEINTKELES